MATSIQIIESVEDDIERGEPVDVKLGIFDVGMVCFQLRIGAELLGDVLRYLQGMSETCTRCDIFPLDKLTSAFDFLICSWRNRNWRFRLLRSMVSRSTMWISPKPVSSRFLRSSHPIPPAPTSNTRDYQSNKLV
jgi:hypothetical protein